MATIIGIKGPSQCGKSTLAAALEAEYKAQGKTVVRTAFSDAVRQEIASLLSTSLAGICGFCGTDQEEQTWDKLRIACIQELKQQHKGVILPQEILNYLAKRPASKASREIQQWWGQDYRRSYNPNYWIKKSFLANIDHVLSPDTVIIEESVRQQNEGAYLRAMGGVVIELVPLAAPTESEAKAKSHAIDSTIPNSWNGDFQLDMKVYFESGSLYKEHLIQSIISSLKWSDDPGERAYMLNLWLMPTA